MRAPRALRPACSTCPASAEPARARFLPLGTPASASSPAAPGRALAGHEAEGYERLRVAVGHERLASRRERTLDAIGSWADPAARPYGHDLGRIVEVDSVRIDELARLRQLASQADREQLFRPAPATAAAFHRARNPEKARPVRHFDDLGKDAPGVCECLVHMPERTGPAMAGEMEVGRALSLRDVPRLVQSHEIERHAALARTLQRRETMADRLEADPESALQPLDVVARAARLRQELAVGQQQRAGEVVREGLARQRLRGGIGETPLPDLRLQNVSMRQQGILRRQLEGALRIAQ